MELKHTLIAAAVGAATAILLNSISTDVRTAHAQSAGLVHNWSISAGSGTTMFAIDQRSGIVTFCNSSTGKCKVIGDL